MTFQMSDQPQTVKVYNYKSSTNEFIGTGDAYIAPHTGLPAYCTTILPPEPSENTVAIFDEENQAWQIIEDHRGETVFSTITGMAIYISEPAPLPDNVARTGPKGKFEKWDGSAWVNDDEAERQFTLTQNQAEKNRLLGIAGKVITPLQDAFDLDIATNEEKERLLVWKRFRVDVSRVDTSDPEWPEIPS